MPATHSAPARSSFFARRGVEVATLLYALFLFQIGLIPLAGAPPRTADGTRAFLTTVVDHVTVPDALANLALYVPLGALWRWTLGRHLRIRGVAILGAVALAVAQSFIIEAWQCMVPSRVSSLYDLIGNAIGAIVGVALTSAMRAAAIRATKYVVRECRHRPQAIVLNAYILLLGVFAALPFTLSFDVARLKQAVKKVNLAPFATAEVDRQAAAFSGASDVQYRAGIVRWIGLKRWSRWAAECASFVLLAWLLHAVIRGDYGFGRRTGPLLIVWSGCLVACFLSVAQFFIVSRACDVTDVLCRMIGLAAGMVTRPWIFPRTAAHRAPALAVRRVTLTRCAGWFVLTLIVYNGLLPLQFDPDLRRVGQTVAAPDLMPFFSYVQNQFDVMFDDMLEKLATYFVFAALLAAVSIQKPGARVGPRVAEITIVAIVVSLIIEAAQVFLPVRVPTLTDPILAAVGAATGAVSYFYAVDYFRLAHARSLVDSVVTQEPAPAPSLGLVDAVIASLMEPRPDAPRERTPVRERSTMR